MFSSAFSDFSEFVSNTTECTELQLVRQSNAEENSQESEPFKPEFTYPIFGEQETVFGYKGLQIKINYASGSLKTYLNISYKEKFNGQGTNDTGVLEAADIKGTLSEYLPSDVLSNYDEFIRIVQEDAKTFKPLGEKMSEYKVETEDGDEEQYEIYRTTFSNTKFRSYHDRMQLFALLFIEGSSYIDNEDEKWEIYTVFEKQGQNESAVYHFVGYCTAYPFFCWPENIRMRISQFLILPPYQKQGHGNSLYQTLYCIFTTRNEVCELTVEDPNEEFSNLRDKNDMRILRDQHAFQGLQAPVPEEKIKELQKRFKLTERQIRRCVEMYLLSKLNKLDSAAYKAYRLQVKQRLYLFNIDALKDMDADEMKEKLQATYDGVEEEYHDLLEQV
ncbi:DNA-binding transcription regulator [Phycomyces blakesleeanus]|uniref:Histone acetyltransferase type B catalytic subunit n=1 Tax=Phycomyces blakesleeanus TaxID=4837 RepID=A0ABR3B4W9_PHYBL